jgi:DNA helicase IV
MPPLRMPGVDDLTEEQDKILRLPDEGRYFVGGPPGTGKTIVLLLRAIAMNARNNPPVTITYNKLLNNYCIQVLQSKQLDLSVKTFHSWFCSHFRRNYGNSPPEIKQYSYNWDEIFERCATNQNLVKSHVPLLIDEGQDLPRNFYRYLSFHFANIMVFADENQMLDEEQNSTKEMIWAELGISNNDNHKFMLTINHRNTLEIARVASHFYAGTDAGKPTLPEKRGNQPYLIQYEDIDHLAERIVRHASLHPHALVGVITTKNESQDLFRGVLEQKSNAKEIRFTCFRSGTDVTVDFNIPGILLLNQQSVKGLEFTSTLIVDLNQHFVHRTGVAHKMKLYVSTSRAVEKLYLFHNKNEGCPILELMPGEDILKRYSLEAKGTPHA